MQRTYESKMKTISYFVTENLISQNSFGIINAQDSVQLQINIGINEHNHGYFEFFDVETQGDEWYAEGGLWLDGKRVIQYDGVFALPTCITEKLEELGYDCSEVKS